MSAFLHPALIAHQVRQGRIATGVYFWLEYGGEIQADTIAALLGNMATVDRRFVGADVSFIRTRAEEAMGLIQEIVCLRYGNITVCLAYATLGTSEVLLSRKDWEVVRNHMLAGVGRKQS